jgi:hypothetical protein
MWFRAGVNETFLLIGSNLAGSIKVGIH